MGIIGPTETDAISRIRFRKYNEKQSSLTKNLTPNPSFDTEILKNLMYCRSLQTAQNKCLPVTFLYVLVTILFFFMFCRDIFFMLHYKNIYQWLADQSDVISLHLS